MSYGRRGGAETGRTGVWRGCKSRQAADPSGRGYLASLLLRQFNRTHLDLLVNYTRSVLAADAAASRAVLGGLHHDRQAAPAAENAGIHARSAGLDMVSKHATQVLNQV